MKLSSLLQRVLTSIVTSAWFVIVYNFTNWVTSRRSDIGVAVFSWESYIPFIPIFVIPYWSIDLFFIAAPFFLKDIVALKIYRRRILLGITIAGTFFLLFPLQLQFKRPPVEGILGFLHHSLDNFNNFWNLAPSLHITLRTILWSVYMPLCGVTGRYILGAWFVCIGVSTLFCWQHHVIDVFTGQLLGLFLIQIIHPSSLQDREPPTRRHLQLAFRYSIVSSLWIFLCYLCWPYGFVLLWPAVSFVLVALAYLRNDPEGFGKFEGKMVQSAWWMFLPYRALAKGWQRQYLSEGFRSSQICPELSIGSMPGSEDLKKIDATGILDLTAEYPVCKSTNEKFYRSVPLLDLVTPTVVELERAVLAIEELSEKGNIFAHCALGFGRSAIVAAAWLLYKKHTTSGEEAIATVVSICKGAVFKENDRKNLNDFMKRINHG